LKLGFGSSSMRSRQSVPSSSVSVSWSGSSRGSR
jgi:hypothetical protein